MLAGPSKGYSSLAEYVGSWRTMFMNARTFNQTGSDIYERAEELEKIFDAQLEISLQRYHLSITDSEFPIQLE